MKRLMMLSAAFVGAVALAEPAALSADLRVLHDEKQWTVKTTFLGWTRESRPVYRALVCDQDEGGGRGPWCQLDLCVAKAYDDAEAKSLSTVQADCTSLVNLDLSSDDRTTVKDSVVTAAYTTALDALGPLEAGARQPNGSVKLVDRKQVVTLSRSMKGAPARTVAVFAYQKNLDGAPQSTRDHKVTEVWITPEGRCTVTLGRFTFVSRWEGQQTTRPMPFARLVCD
jgi:hypothetical protein